MKRKYMALLLGLTLAGTQAGAVMASENTVTEGSAAAGDAQEMPDQQGMPEMPQGDMEADANAIRGEVTAIEDGQITIETADGEQTVTVTDETTVTKRSGMGGPGQGGGNGEVPEKPDGDSSEAPEKPDGDNSEAPEKPDGDSGEAPEKPDGDGGEASEKPDGDSGEVPEKPDGEGTAAPGEEQSLSLADIEVGDTVSVTLAEDGSAQTIAISSADSGMPGGAPGGMPGGSSEAVTGDALNDYTESAEISGEEITSTASDENAVRVSAEEAEVSVSDSSIVRDSDDSTGGDNSSFYGVGAALLATEGTLYVSDSEITTDAAGGAGIFAYGNGTAYAADDTITTTQDTSGGIHVAGGGTLYAWNLTVNTAGESSAAIRSDRGSGTMVVDGGSYTSTGTGSPAIYSTADITVNGADLTAEGSEAICIEGLNTIRLYDCNLSGNMSDNEQNDVTWNVIVYQSMSGDSEEGNGTFEMNGGTLTAGNGGMFYTTNTESTITLNNVTIIPAEENDFFMQCTGNTNARGWGSAGSNGADCLFTGISQVMDGDVIWDSISDLDFYMTQGSILTGAFINDETWAGSGSDGYANLYIDETSTWTVTGDSTLSALFNAGTITDENGDTVSVVGTDGTVYVEGDSAYTVTVDSYEDAADVSGASVSSVWEDHAVEMPASLT